MNKTSLIFILFYLSLILLFNCIKSEETNDLRLTTATYLGYQSQGYSQAHAVDLHCTLSGQYLLVGGASDADPFTIASSVHRIRESKDGSSKEQGMVYILRYGAENLEMESLSIIDRSVNDVQSVRMNDTDDSYIAVATDQGALVLDSSGSYPVWSSNPIEGGASRIAIDNNGILAMISGTTITVYDTRDRSDPQNPSILGTKVIDRPNIADVALDAVSQSVMVTGYRQVNPQLQEPYIYSWDYRLTTSRWTWFDGEGASKGATADCRGEGISLGADGYAYFVGTADGGNNVYQKTIPNSIKSFDPYTALYNCCGGGKVTFYMRLNPLTGDVDTGQFMVSRLTSSNRGNSFTTNSIAADEDGNIILGSSSACCIPQRDHKTINGQSVASYTFNEGVATMINANMSARYFSAVFGVPSHPAKGAIQDVVSRNGITAVVASITSGRMYTPSSALSSPSSDASQEHPAAWLAVWPSHGARREPIRCCCSGYSSSSSLSSNVNDNNSNDGSHSFLEWKFKKWIWVGVLIMLFNFY